jgi:hypothetical protein
MEYEPPERARFDPPITVESAMSVDTDASEWTEPVAKRPERHRCTHGLRFSDLNARGRTTAVGLIAVIAASWALIVLGFLVGLGLIAAGFADGDQRLAVVGLLLACGTALQSFGVVALASACRRPHRPHDVAIALAAVGLLVFLIALVMLVAIADMVAAPALAVPFAAVLVHLFRFQSALYGRDTCRTHPGHAPAVRELLAHDPGPAIVAPERFRVRDCPHRLKFGMLRRRSQVMLIVNTVLVYVYFALLLWMISLNELLVPALLSGLIGIVELSARSQRYHRASTWVYVCAFAGYALAGAAGVWAAVTFGEPLLFAVPVLAAYWCFSAWFALTQLTPRSACRSMMEPPPAIRRMLKA